jgi:hypothetical protein
MGFTEDATEAVCQFTLKMTNITNHATATTAASHAKDYKLMAEELAEHLKSGDHFRILQLAQQWTHLGAGALHDAMNRASIKTRKPTADQSGPEYVAALPLANDDYCRCTLVQHINLYNHGRATATGTLAQEAADFAEQLASITVGKSTGSAEDAARRRLGTQLGFPAYHSFSTFFRNKEASWAKVCVRFLEASTEEDFIHACRAATRTGQTWTLFHRSATTTGSTSMVNYATTHEREGPPQPTRPAGDTSTYRSGHKDSLARYSRMSYQERRALRETGRPPTTEGQCTFCYKHGHAEENCYIRKELSAIIAHPN